MQKREIAVRQPCLGQSLLLALLVAVDLLRLEEKLVWLVRWRVRWLRGRRKLVTVVSIWDY